VETGTHRQGVWFEEIAGFAQAVARLPGVVIEGAYTHLATAEDTADDSYLRLQVERFNHSLEMLAQVGIQPRYRHMAATAAAMLAPQSRGNLVRLGIGMYGLWPSLDTQVAMHERSGGNFALWPALRWKTRIVQLARVPKGEPVGYGLTYRTRRASQLAVLPVGYADGYDRHLSNIGEVLVRGEIAPVVGRVMMNMTIVDVTDSPTVQVGDEVILLGPEMPADRLATQVGTINYEIVTRISPLLPRVIVP
jgi:alanine racemase